MPLGRFVSGKTRTSIVQVTVIGVCIPWSGSLFRGTEVKRRMWEDHEQYLEGLSRILEAAPHKQLIDIGDFNQRIGLGGNTPHKLRSALQSVVSARLTIGIAALGFRGRRTIDHIALSNDLAIESLGVISNIHGDTKLSDHFGVVASLSTIPIHYSRP